MSLTSESAILERARLATDDAWNETKYWLRLVVANFLDGDGGQRAPQKGGGRFGDVDIRHWEEGRDNPISDNTLASVEGLTFNEPDGVWRNVPDPGGRGDLIGAVRWAYFMDRLWRKQSLGEQYSLKLLDLLTIGEANMGCFVRGDSVEVEWCDSLCVEWDPAHKDPMKRRFVFYEKPMPLRDAIRYYPEIAKIENVSPSDDKAMERTVYPRCYWDRDNQTTAVLYKRSFAVAPTKSPYPEGVLPIRASQLWQLPSVKRASGLVERQIGSQQLALRLMRHFRDTALKATGTRIASGGFNEDQLRALEDGDDPILRGPLNADYRVTKGAEIQSTALQVYQIVKQHMIAQSGINEFKLGQTDVNVNFASQLGFLAQQSGSRDKFLAQRLEDGLRDDIQKLIMPIAAAFEAGEFRLNIGGTTIEFGPMQPINAILGSDGDIALQPGGMTFKSPAQALQETMILTNVLSQTASAPPGLQERLVKLALQSAGIEAPDDWLTDMQSAQQQIAAQQAAMASAQAPVAASSPGAGDGF